MPYLYGDSSSSGLEVNYIQLLRDALEFSVEVLLAIHRIRRWETSQRDRSAAAEFETQELTQLQADVFEAMGDRSEADGTPVGRAAASVGRSVAGSVSAETHAIESALADDLARMNAEIVRERQICVRALEALLLRHDLPETTRGVHVTLEDNGQYVARLLEVALHLESVLALDIPAGHTLSQPMRVDGFTDPLDVKAPKKGGWISKKVKLVNHKLAKKYVVEVLLGVDQSVLKLRASPALADSGFDIVVDAEGTVRLTSVSKEGEEGDPYEPEDHDAAKLRALHDAVAEQVRSLTANRSQLIDASLDGRPLDQHDNPAILVERLVMSMSPVVREIAGHSLQDGELVLKRVLDDDRREEIFISKAELERQLSRLPAEMRTLFAPLGLGGGGGGGDQVSDPAKPPPTPVVPEQDTTEDAVTMVSTANGRLPQQATTVTGEIDKIAKRTEESDLIPIDDEWLEEDSQVQTQLTPTPVVSAENVLAELEAESDIK